ncbi:hypothetical protein [Rhizobium sp. CFBP 8762]|uniref:hypothetical protein n=1 Tax=Rhizobium sp. CFBP 8762 TaxID=2775279 RepID=UPI001FD0290A|nr:hypothetical protein [Rhizobium sp. CFBP 8762]
MRIGNIQNLKRQLHEFGGISRVIRKAGDGTGAAGYQRQCAVFKHRLRDAGSGIRQHIRGNIDIELNEKLAHSHAAVLGYLVESQTQKAQHGEIHRAEFVRQTDEFATKVDTAGCIFR